VPVVLHALPNLLTILRGLSGPAILACVLLGQDEVAFTVFLLAVLTDLADGWLARRLGATSELGTLLDPVADKLLVDGTWLALGLAGWAPWWLAGPVLARDAAVILGFLLLGGQTREPHMLGRVMVSVEGVALPVLLFRNPWLDVHWPTVGLVLGGISLVLALASAGIYLLDITRGRVPLPTRRRPAGPGGAAVLPPRPWPRPPSTPT